MKPGLRLQILLLLGGLLLLAFVPLFYAVATYTNYTLQQLRENHARSLGRAVAAHVAEARENRTVTELMGLLGAQVGTEGVQAIGVYGADKKPVARVGEPSVVSVLPAELEARESVYDVQTARGRALAVVVTAREGAVIAILRSDDAAARAAPLVRLVGLYTALVALVLLVFAYFALTRLIVRPLDELAKAAERVAGGARRLVVPQHGARELGELGVSLRTMTEKLISEEQALRKKIDEVERATESLKQAQERLVRSERLASVGRLAAGLAHEIGNPISALMGLEDLLLSGGLDEAEQRDFLQRMRRETERIHRILRDLLKFARPAAREGPSNPAEPGDVERAVLDTAALLLPQQSLRDVELALDLAPDLQAVALSSDELVQVTLNLVMNAADAVGPGGHVKVFAHRSELGVRLCVEDDGPGVPAEVQSRLFEPFVTTKEVGKGTGLGLAVCRGMVEAVGGNIALDRTFTSGARFVIELPKAEQ